jgi:hypothetical protein
MFNVQCSMFNVRCSMFNVQTPAYAITVTMAAEHNARPAGGLTAGLTSSPEGDLSGCYNVGQKRVPTV